MTKKYHPGPDLIPTVDIGNPQSHTATPERAARGAEEQLQERWASLLESTVDRRRFLKIMSASIGAAGLAGCRTDAPEEIVPYINDPEGMIPGRPSYYNSVFTREGYGYGVVVESHEGRPTKVEGNPNHPASLGASDVFMQAELLNLYDPDRSRSIREGRQIRSQGELELALFQQREKWLANGGQGVATPDPPSHLSLISVAT